MSRFEAKPERRKAGGYAWLFLAAAGVVVVGAGWLWIAYRPAPAPQVITTPAEATRSQVTEHLQRLDRDRQLRRQELRNVELGSEPLTPGVTPPVFLPPTRLDLSQDPRTPEVARDVHQPSEMPDAVRDLDNQVNRDLARKQMEEELLLRQREQYKEQYIRSFLENAKKAGYDLKVDKNLRVIENSAAK